MEDVRNWLRGRGLDEHASMFEEEGWDILDVLPYMTKDDIQTCISKPGHRKSFQLAVSKHSSHTSPANETKEANPLKTWNAASGMNDVRNWLRGNGLEQYAPKFDAEGWDALDVLSHIAEDDVTACISKPGHRKRFHVALSKRNIATSYLDEITQANNSTEYDADSNMEAVRNWLTRCGLEQYVSSFEKEGWDSLVILPHINEEDIKSCIAKAGHRQRFHLALNKTESVTISPNWSNQEHCSSESDAAQNGGNAKDCKVRHGSEINGQAEIGAEDAHSGHKYIKENAIDIVSDENGLQTLTLNTMDHSEDYSDMIPSTGINFHHANIAGIYNINSSPDEEKGERDYFKKQMQTLVIAHEEKDNLYVKTRALNELVDIVEASYMAIIIGVPGDGKSAMAYHLSLEYNKKGYEYLELHFAREWKAFVDGGIERDKGSNKQFVVIDDIFGRMSVDERKESEWCSILDLMQRVVRQRKGDLIVVCTCRKYIFVDMKSHLTGFSAFQDSSVVDMTSANMSLTQAEKMAIWHNFTEKYKVEAEKPDCISKDLPTPHGFPHCVELFCTNLFLQRLQRKGGSFFQNPVKYVEIEIIHFRASDRTKYAILLLVLLHGNKLPKCFLDQLSDREHFWRLFDAAGLDTQPKPVDLEKALESLKSSYISELDRHYCFSHDLFREIIAHLFIKGNTTYALQELDFTCLTDHTRCCGQTAGVKQTVFILPPEKNIELIKRIIKEIKSGNVVAVCAHQAWECSLFIEEFMQWVLPKTESDTKPNSTGQRRTSEIFETKDNMTSCIFYFNLFDALNFYRRRNALGRILANEDLKLLLQDVAIVPTEVPRNRSLSSKLCRIMDGIGATEEVRANLVASTATMEILDTVCTKLANKDLSCYIFGSQTEGTHIPTHTPKLESAVTYMFCLEDCEVIHNISEARPEKHVDYLAVSDETSKPGYVKLQVVLDGVPQTASHFGGRLPENTTLDYKNRVVFLRKHPGEIHVDERLGLQTTTNIITGNTFDKWHSYRCRTWPDVTKEWLNRVRHHNWPSRHALEQMKSLGFFLVPVGCRDSIEEHLEWKMCFLLQERMLLSNLNQTQHKCYVILKMINNDIVSYFVKEPALISYHLKTCMFHVIENTPYDIWVPAKLLYGVKHCLNCILKWTINGNCPNYFIPEENMFYRQIHGELQAKLRNALENLLASDFEYFVQIKCGNVGALLEQAITAKPGNIKPKRVIAEDDISIYLKTVRFIVLVKDRMLSKCWDQDLRRCVQSHLDTVVMLKRTLCITEHTREQTKQSISWILPYVELSLMNNLVALAANDNSRSKQLMNVLLSNRWHVISLQTNSFSAKLSQATILYVLKYPKTSLQILESLKMSLGPFMISLCGCRHSQQTIVDKKTKDHLKGKSEEEFRTKYCMPCLVFLPTELAPDAIKYEMKRSAEPASVSGNTPYRFWYDWAVVDSKVLLHFLLYLNHTELNMTKEATADVKNLDDVLKTDPNLGHKDTGFNLLGWINRQTGNKQLAMEYFRQSLEHQPTYNAAHFHMNDTPDIHS